MEVIKGDLEAQTGGCKTRGACGTSEENMDMSCMNIFSEQCAITENIPASLNYIHVCV